METARHKAPENGTLPRITIFRQKIIQEFQVLDNVTDIGNVSAPIYTSRDFMDVKLRAKILSENPFQLIKFPAYKRARVEEEDSTDRRLNRTRNTETLPLSIWASWLVNHTVFKFFLDFLILVNVILMAIDAEMSLYEYKYWAFGQFFVLYNALVIFLLYMEIYLKVLDDYRVFLRDGWQFTDLLLTVISTIPEIAEYTGTNSQFKVIRLIRVFKLVIRSRTSRVIILTIMQAFKSMALIMTFVFVTAYCYAILSVYLFEDYTKSINNNIVYRDYFDTFGTSVMTLFQFLTLDHWDHVNRDVRVIAEPVWTQIYIISWVWLGAFIFRGIFVGVMVQNFDRISEAIKSHAEDDKKKKKFEKMRQKLNNELAAQNNIKKSMQSLKATADELRQSKMSIQKSKATLHLDPNTATKKIEDMLENIQELVKQSHGASRGWEKTIEATLQTLTENHKEANWPRDTLFRYFQLMESLQENMKEYQELQLLSSRALLDLHDT